MALICSIVPYFSFTQIQIGAFTFYPWGFFLGLAFLIGSWLVLKEAVRKGINQKKTFWLIVSVFLSGLIGSRLAYILQFPSYYLNHFLEIFQIWTGGLMFYGGLLGALISGWLYIKKTRLNFWQIADMLAPALAIGIFIGRIGCSLINDHQGAATDLPWGIIWPDGIIRHPVAEYLALNGLIMFLVFWFLKNYLRKPGRLFIIFIFWYSLSRFLLDFTRASGTLLSDPHYWSLTVSQWFSLFALIGLSIFFIAKRAIIK
ncbi:MAG: hypothetical protein AVO34_01975 [Firmicutes bacterium ML8_F2]|jgi:phosphatidylglycerol---prolipoprotein diacylglyceryl transferase|nr:MAG: hypothetical protein AVO34_01975 [Firmicutes bacterium ML8_F2]